MSFINITTEYANFTSDNLLDNGKFTPTETATIAVLGGILAFVTLTGNLLVMVSFGVNKKIRKLSNYFLASLSVADSAIGLVSMPLYTVYVLEGGWLFGALPCDLWLSMDYVMSNSSALHLVAICIDRYLSVNRPLTYRANRTSRHVLCMILFIWLVSIVLWIPWIFSIPYIEGGRTVPTNECYIQFLYSNDYVTIITHILAFWLPVIVMVGFYQRVYRATREHKKFTAKHANHESVYAISNGGFESSGSNDQEMVNGGSKPPLNKMSTFRKLSCAVRIMRIKMHADKENDKAAKTLSAILLAFIVTWMPYHVNVIISCFCTDCVPHAVYNFGYWLCYINSTINPFLYALCNTDFRWTFLAILTCNRRRIDSRKSNKRQQRNERLDISRH